MARIKTRNTTRILNCIGSKNTHQDWDIKTVLADMLQPGVKLPKRIDLRKDWWKVSDQGETGSCVGWSSVDGVLRWHMVKKRKLKTTERLSVRFVWMAAKEMDEFSDKPSTFIEDAGTSLKCALDVLRKFGCVKESVLPFGKAKLFPGTEDDFFKIAGRMKITAYYNILKGEHDKVHALKRWLASGNGPILTCIDVDRTWYGAKETKGMMKEYYSTTKEGGHAICIVGYTEDCFIIRNSWGSAKWGDKGFGYASYKYVEEAICEAYGVVVE